MRNNGGSDIYRLVCCAMFTALMAVGAYIKIVLPLGIYSVTVSLQLFFALLSGVILGAYRGGLSVLCYIFIGLLGLPVFAHGGGIYYVMKPTFGFIAGFALAAYTAGRAYEKLLHGKNRSGALFAACLFGEAAYYICGLIYYYIMFNYVLTNGLNIGIVELLTVWLFSTLPADTLISLGAAGLAKQLIPLINKAVSGNASALR